MTSIASIFISLLVAYLCNRKYEEVALRNLISAYSNTGIHFGIDSRKRYFWIRYEDLAFKDLQNMSLNTKGTTTWSLIVAQEFRRKGYATVQNYAIGYGGHRYRKSN